MPAQADILMNGLSGTEYFSYFDYKDREDPSEVFEFERKLIEQALSVEDFLTKKPNYEPPSRAYSSRHRLAMTLVYAGMLILNNNNGSAEGYYSLAHLRSGGITLSLESTLKSEITARYDLCVRLLALAQKTDPEDGRIDSWYAAAIMHRQRHVEGKVDAKTLDWITANAVRDPMFHLFSALTMNSDFDFGPERESALLSKVEWLNSRESPCRQLFFRRGEAKKCNTTHKTPFAFQGVSVYMGDYYLRESLNHIGTDPEKSKDYAKKASKLYTRVDWFIFKPKAKKWNMFQHLPERKHLAKDLMAGINSTDGFFQSRRFLDIYTCTSCHQNGQSKKALHLRLPSDETSQDDTSKLTTPGITVAEYLGAEHSEIKSDDEPAARPNRAWAR